MATAEELRKEFTDYMDEREIKYTVLKEDDNIVYLAFGGDQDTYVMVDFDENDNDSESVHFSSHDFAVVEKANVPAALVKLNEVNQKYRWVKFYMSDNNKLCADCDATIFPGSVGYECFRSACRLSDIIEIALKDFEGIAEPDEDAMKMFTMIAAFKSMGME